MLAKGYKLSVRRWINSGALMHSIVFMAKYTVVYTWKFLRE